MAKGLPKRQTSSSPPTTKLHAHIEEFVMLKHLSKNFKKSFITLTEGDMSGLDC
jgi:hypothetical protein